jgi:hypothetical protein
MELHERYTVLDKIDELNVNVAQLEKRMKRSQSVPLGCEGGREHVLKPATPPVKFRRRGLRSVSEEPTTALRKQTLRTVSSNMPAVLEGSDLSGSENSLFSFVTGNGRDPNEEEIALNYPYKKVIPGISHDRWLHRAKEMKEEEEQRKRDNDDDEF